MDPDFEQLSNDVDLISRLGKFHEATDKIADTLKLVDNPGLYDKLSKADKIKYNLLMSFGMNTLFWMYLRAEGIDPMTHQIKNENERLKQSMMRSQQIKDKKTIMPRINVNAAKRFIRNGLWTPNDGQSEEPEEDWDKPEEEAASAVPTTSANSETS